MFENGEGTEPVSPRPHYLPLHDVLGTLSAEDYRARCLARDRSFRDQGITFSLSGEQRPFPLDLVPRVVPAEEWSVIERGVVQRVRALEAFLSDIYGPQEVLADGVLPRRLVLSSTHFLDPLQFNPHSLLGCPGLLNAARAGNVTIANGVGNGVADDKALYPRVPDLVRYYLNEEPVLSN
jgi:uncharacterized circularly permuted ATP-grasp superfamily protein